MRSRRSARAARLTCHGYPSSAPVVHGRLLQSLTTGSCVPGARTTRRRSTSAAPLTYEFPVDAAIRQFKFHRKLHYASAFGELLCKAAADLPADIDALLPVPLHWLRHGIRGFNQATEICRPLQKASGLPVIRNVSRIRRTHYQSGLGSRERRRNLAGAFAVRGAIDSRHVLLIDDVITTGETCAQLARELLAHGTQKVSVLALARA